MEYLPARCKICISKWIPGRRNLYRTTTMIHNKGKEDKVLRLKKALYGLKQAPRAWYSRTGKYFHQKGFKKSPYEATLYIKVEGPDILVLSLYVDDLIVTGSNLTMINNFKEQMMKMFEMTDLGMMNYFLEMEIDQRKEGIFICPERYANIILK